MWHCTWKNFRIRHFLWHTQQISMHQTKRPWCNTNIFSLIDSSTHLISLTLNSKISPHMYMRYQQWSCAWENLHRNYWIIGVKNAIDTRRFHGNQRSLTEWIIAINEWCAKWRDLHQVFNIKDISSAVKNALFV